MGGRGDQGLWGQLLSCTKHKIKKERRRQQGLTPVCLRKQFLCKNKHIQGVEVSTSLDAQKKETVTPSVSCQARFQNRIYNRNGSKGVNMT